MIDPAIKALAIKKYTQGDSPAHIANTLEISKRTLHYWVKGRPKPASVRKVGRPPKISSRAKKWIKEKLVSQKGTASDITKALNKKSKGKVNVSVRTVQRAA